LSPFAFFFRGDDDAAADSTASSDSFEVFVFVFVLIRSSPRMTSNENLSPMVTAKLMKEIRAICVDPPEGISIQINDDNIGTINADIDGPQGTPFEGGLFRCRLILGPDFPSSPPKGLFLTKIFHPNVSPLGEICVNTLKKDWKPDLGIKHVLLVIRCLLIEPNPESALNEEAGKLLLEAYDDYAKRAQMMTKIHAKPKVDKSKSTKAVVEVKEAEPEVETETENEPTNTNTNTNTSKESDDAVESAAASSSPLKKKAKGDNSSNAMKPPMPKPNPSSKPSAAVLSAVNSAADKKKLLKKQSLRRL